MFLIIQVICEFFFPNLKYLFILYSFLCKLLIYYSILAGKYNWNIETNAFIIGICRVQNITLIFSLFFFIKYNKNKN